MNSNPFTGNAFSTIALTAAINLLPNRYGRCEELKIFPSKGSRFRTVAIEERNGTLSMLPTAALGAPGTVGTRGKRTMRSFVIPHIPHDDVVLPEEVQGVRAFGSDMTTSLAEVMAEKLQAMRDRHAITLEHLRMGALRGEVLDADGSTLYNFYDEFGVTAKEINFELDDGTTDVRAKVIGLKRHIEDNLLGEFMTGIQCLVSGEFFDALTSHANVIRDWERWQNGEALRSDQRSGFTYAGVTFEEYRGQATDQDGTVRRFIGEAEGHAFPVGTGSTFATLFAPADFNETANTMGLPLYVKQEPRKFDRGTDLHSQSNPLPICFRPGVLVKVKAE
ncbi:MAG: major capsid protein [Magnetococcales bacterium]|nr:major capsid protein [Magnetococcales bacterium]